MPPKRAAAAFAFFLSALLSTGAGLAAGWLEVAGLLNPPVEGWLVLKEVDEGVVVCSGAFASSGAEEPQTRLALPMFRVAAWPPAAATAVLG